DALAGEQVHEVGLQPGLDLLDAGAQALEVELGPGSGEAHAGAAVDEAHGPGRGDHGLRGDAVPEVRRAADDVLLDHRHASAETCCGGGRRVAGRSTADDDEAKAHGLRLPAEGERSGCRPGRREAVGGGDQATSRASRTIRWSGVNSRLVRPSPMTTTLVATVPRIRYMMAACTSTASTGSTPARMRPVIAPGRNTSPTAFVFSICEVSAVRRAMRTNGLDASGHGWPSARRA